MSRLSTGGKVANFSKLAVVHPIPTGFYLTTHAVDDHMRLDYRDAILQAYATLEQIVGQPEVSVAVRSSVMKMASLLHLPDSTRLFSTCAAPV